METNKQNKTLVFVIATIAATGGLLFGFDTGVISGALPFLHDHWSLSDNNMEWLTTAVLVGAVLGALLSGRITDIWGRKKVIISTAFIFAIGAVWTGWANSFGMLTSGRIAVGFAIGIASFSVPLYLAEISPAKNRGALVSLNQLMITIGILISYISDYLIADNSNTESWRWMFFIGLFPALVLLIGMFFVPETPRWLIGKGREAEGKAVLQKIEDPNLVDEIIAKMKHEIRLDEESNSNWTEVFKPWLRPALLIAIGIMFFQQFTGINTIIYYSPIIFKMAGFTSNEASIAPSIIVGVVNVFFTVISIALIDRIGRKRLFFIGLSGMVLSLIFMAISFFFEESLGNALKWVTVSSVLLYIAFFAISLGPIAWLIISEVFPLKVRGVGMSIGSLSNWFFNGIVAFTFLSLVKTLSATGAFMLYAVIGVIGLFLGYLYLPETKGKSLEQIEEHWRQGKSPKEL